MKFPTTTGRRGSLLCLLTMAACSPGSGGDPPGPRGGNSLGGRAGAASAGNEAGASGGVAGAAGERRDSGATGGADAGTPSRPDSGSVDPSERHTIDLQPYWDDKTPLPNPDKGWFHHQYDNGTGSYPVTASFDLSTFPGLDHAYVRLSWAHFEPQEGRYDWSLIDDVVTRWTAQRLRVALKITCKETYEAYATPEWVRVAGANGTFYPGANGLQTWAPDYGDPTFLGKLENFLRALATRYDGKPFLAYMDLGSIGDWGEGHTNASSKTAVPVEVIRKHMDLHARTFPKSLVVVGDDLITYRHSQSETSSLLAYAKTLGFGMRDDSVLVDYYVQTYPTTFSVSDPDLFQTTFPLRPTLLELQHYGSVKSAGDWTVPNGAMRGAEILRGAIRTAHATFVGYHGRIDTWLNENPQLARDLINSMGYWLFLKSAQLPARAVAGAAMSVGVTWTNRGVARPYQRYVARIALQPSAGGAPTVLPIDTSDSRRFAPGSDVTEWYTVTLPPALAAGHYAVRFALTTRDSERPILVGMSADRRDDSGNYLLDELDIDR